MNLIKIDTGEYPVSLQAFKERHPNVSFPAQIPFADFGYAVVFETPRPAYDPLTQTAAETAPALTDKGHWEQTWQIVAL